MIKIVQPLNNNVVMGYDRKKGEVIIIGTGIGFRAKKGDQVDESKIQKMFITGENKQLLEMIGAIPPEYFELVEEIFENLKNASASAFYSFSSVFLLTNQTLISSIFF